MRFQDGRFPRTRNPLDLLPDFVAEHVSVGRMFDVVGTVRRISRMRFSRVEIGIRRSRFVFVCTPMPSPPIRTHGRMPRLASCLTSCSLHPKMRAAWLTPICSLSSFAHG
jgi:hypothetical protein